MQGSAKRNLVMFKKLCGNDALRNVILGTTMWDKVHEAEGCRREEELSTTPDFWGWMLSRGSVMLRHKNNRTSALELIDKILNRDSTVVLELQEEMVGANMPLRDTGVGRELKSEIKKERERYKKDLARVRAEIEESRKKRDNETTSYLQEVKNELTEKMQKSESELNRLQEERREWRREREELKLEMERLAATTPAAPHGRDTEEPWFLDPVKNQYYYFSTEEDAWVYESGDRIFRNSGTSAQGRGPQNISQDLNVTRQVHGQEEDELRGVTTSLGATRITEGKICLSVRWLAQTH
jgi:predicted RNase H-like nuclease (RuvC/YqgF family)